jgi:hypothetical protein
MSREATVDALALVAFFTVVAGATELLIAGLSPRQVLISRAATVPVLLLTGRPYGLWRDAILTRTGARGRGRAALLAVDTAAFLSFQVPIYAAILVVAGATPDQMIRALAAATVGMLILGGPYGLFLDWVRRRAGVAPRSAL